MAIPHGVGLTFFAGLANALGLHYFLPANFGEPWRDRALRERLEAEPPDLVVILPFEYAEYGVQGFGVDYAQETWEWIRTHFEPWRRDGVWILKRRGLPEPPQGGEGKSH